MKKLFVLLPTLNPKEELIKYIKELTTIKNINVIVVNDGSNVKYNYVFEIIEKMENCTLLNHDLNLGKGKALKTGFKYFLENYKSDKVAGIITADSDGQHDIKDILNIGQILSDLETNSLILGTRNFNKKDIPLRSRYGNKITTTLFHLLYGKKISDTQTGLRGLTYSFVKECMSLEGDRFEYEINMLIFAIRKKINIIEHNIKTIYIDNNSESHFKPIRDSFKIYRIIFKQFFKY